VTRSARDRHVEALDALLRGRVAVLIKAREWDLLAEVARLAQEDAPKELAVTDPALFEAWRNAVTRYHRAGWTNMTPGRVRTATLDGDGAGHRPVSVERIVPLIEEAVRDATTHSLQWSRGIDILDQGIESVMEVYSAKSLLVHHPDRPNILIFTQYPTNKLPFYLPKDVRSGKYDLVVQDIERKTIGFIEFKRHILPTSISRDLERIAATVVCSEGETFDRFGLIAGPMITTSTQFPSSDNYDYESMLARHDFKNKDSVTLQVHKGPASKLPLLRTRRAAADIQFPIVVSVSSKA